MRRRTTRGPLLALTLLVAALLVGALAVPAASVRAAPAIPMSWSRVPSANVLGSDADAMQRVGAGSMSGFSSPLGSNAQGIHGRPDIGDTSTGNRPIGAGARPNHRPFGDGSTYTAIELSSVAAVSSSDIWAVGYSLDTSRTAINTLIEQWNGAVWSIVPSPNVDGTAGSNYLNGVAVVSSSDVWAVGYYYDTSRHLNDTLIEQWNGAVWNIVPSPDAGGSGSNYLNAVAVVSASNVWAVGYYYDTSTTFDNALIEHWNGTKWSIVPSPHAGGTNANNVLNAIAAVSSSDLWAVGYSSTSNSELTLIEQWNGTAWSIVSSPNVSGNLDSLSGVAAVSATDVWAVGAYYFGTSGGSLTVVEQWNGTAWSIVSSPNAGGTNGADGLSGVAAVSASDVWAVGYYYSGSSGAQLTLTEQWNGTSWSVVSSPNASTTNALSGVAAISTNDVWAVGDYYNSTASFDITLTERYGYLLAGVALGATRGALRNGIR